MPPNTPDQSTVIMRRRQSSHLSGAPTDGTGSVRFGHEARSLVDVDLEQPSSPDNVQEEVEHSIHTEHQSILSGPKESDHSEPPPPEFLIDNMMSIEAKEEEIEEPVTWKDVMTTCCCHTRVEWARISVVVLILLFLLYCFLIGLELLSRSFRVVGGCTAESLLGSDGNPIGSLMVGILTTAVLQSSSTTTAIVVSLVSGGLDVQTAIYIVMGANIGTAVTALLVSLAHVGDTDELERAFAGATVVWVFKILTVIVLFPLEVSVQYLYNLTKAMLPSDVGEGESWEGPIKRIVSPLGNKIIIANKKMMDDIASSGGTVTCNDYYPVECKDGVESYTSCVSGLIGCDSKTNSCPLFFSDGATQNDDSLSGWVCLVFALVLLILCLIGLVSLLRFVLLGASQRIIYKATNINGYLAMCIGCGATILVQSSSITISTLIPLIGMGVLSLEKMYPLTLGADIGTTFTALMAAMVSNSVDSLQVALVHLFFNVNGILMWYPIPFMRRVPLNLARRLGNASGQWRGLPLTFLVLSFYVVPLILLLIAICFDQGTTGFTALGVFLVISIVASTLYFVFWWNCKSGNEKCQSCLRSRQRRKAAVSNLADDMDYLKVDMEYVKNEIGRLKQYAGLHHEVRPARPSMHDGSVYTQEQEETLSLYESCRSKAWSKVLMSAARSSAGSIDWSRAQTPRSTMHAYIGSPASVGSTVPTTQSERNTKHSRISSR